MTKKTKPKHTTRRVVLAWAAAPGLSRHPSVALWTPQLNDSSMQTVHKRQAKSVGLPPSGHQGHFKVSPATEGEKEDVEHELRGRRNKLFVKGNKDVSVCMHSRGWRVGWQRKMMMTDRRREDSRGRRWVKSNPFMFVQPWTFSTTTLLTLQSRQEPRSFVRSGLLQRPRRYSPCLKEGQPATCLLEIAAVRLFPGHSRSLALPSTHPSVAKAHTGKQSSSLHTLGDLYK